VSDEIRLLLVEDNPDDAELLKLELERGGFQLDWSRVDNDGDMRRALGERKWDLIISDFSMPGFGGFRAFDVAQEISRDVPGGLEALVFRELRKSQRHVLMDADAPRREQAEKFTHDGLHVARRDLVQKVGRDEPC
jgi:CheY-like chemotaxis protein